MDEDEDVENLCDCTFSLAYGSKILLNNTHLKLKRGFKSGLRRQGGQGFFFIPLEASPDPLRESLYDFSLGNRYINSMWTPLTLGPCGPQVQIRAHGPKPVREDHAAPVDRERAGQRPRANNSGGAGGPPGRLASSLRPPCGLSACRFPPVPLHSACDVVEVAYRRPPWLTGSYHSRSRASHRRRRSRPSLWRPTSTLTTPT